MDSALAPVTPSPVTIAPDRLQDQRSAIAQFLAQHPYARHGGLFQGRLLYTQYSAWAGREFRTVVNYLTFVRLLGPHTDRVVWHSGLVHYRLHPQPTATAHPMQVAATRAAAPDRQEKPDRLDRLTTACAYGSLVAAGLAWGVILHAVLP
jgi:hypothetical protein